MIRSRTVVLCYHRVADPEHDPLGLSVRPETFESQLAWLSTHVEVVPLRGVLDDHPGPRVAITFDDGYADNHGPALEILERSDTPATFFVTSGYIGSGRRFWWDRLTVLMAHPGAPSQLEVNLSGSNYWCDLRSPAARHRAFWFLHTRLMRQPVPLIEEFIDHLEEELGAADSRFRSKPNGALSVAELQTMARHRCCTIGSHTVNHPLLSLLEPSLQADEISSARRQLEALIGLPVREFAYPFGGIGAFTRHTTRAVKRSGHELACTTLSGTVHPRLDRFRIPRFLVRDWDLSDFRSIVARWIDGRA